MQTDDDLYSHFKATGDRTAFVALKRRHVGVMMRTLRRQFDNVDTMKRIVRRAFRRLETQKIAEGEFVYSAYVALCGAAIAERRAA